MGKRGNSLRAYDEELDDVFQDPMEATLIPETHDGRVTLRDLDPYEFWVRRI